MVTKVAWFYVLGMLIISFFLTDFFFLSLCMCVSVCLRERMLCVSRCQEDVSSPGAEAQGL